MKTLTVSSQTVNYNSALQAFVLNLQVTAGDNITTKVFVKQRSTNSAGVTDDSFVAVASPANLEDFANDQPNPGSSYFLTDTINLVSSDPNYLNEVHQSILGELQTLADQMDALANLSGGQTVTITGLATNVN